MSPLSRTIVARELAPAGLRSSPKTSHCILQINRIRRDCDCFAAEREQAPSP